MPFLPGRRLRTLQRSPKIFVPAASGRQIVIPFRPISMLLIIFLTFLSGFLFLRSDFFQVKALDFEFEKIADEALVRQRVTEEVFARSIFFLDPQAIEQRIKKNFPTIKAISIKKNLPDRLRIRVSVRVPLAIVEAKSKARFLIDGEGLLFREEAGESLPVISLGEDFNGGIGFKVSEGGVARYLETLQLVAQKGLTTKAIYLRPQMVELQLEETLVYLDVEKEIVQQIDLLTQLLQRYKLGGQVPKLVDLRFGRPVIKL